MEIYDGVDIYSKEYDYDDLKIAICVAEYLNNVCVSADYEEIAKLTITIKNKWNELKTQGLLSKEEYAYIQRFAINYLHDNIIQIMEELK